MADETELISDYHCITNGKPQWTRKHQNRTGLG